MSASCASVEVHCFPDSAGLGRRLARALAGRLPRGLAAPFRAVSVHRFPDGESLVRVRSPASRQAVLVRQLHDPNSKLFEVLQAIDALRRAGVRELVLVAPYLPYMRQDTSFRAGESVSQRVLAGLFGERIEGLVTLEPHLHRTLRLDDVFSCRVRSVSAAPLLAAWCGRARSRPWLVGPDSESEPWVRAAAEARGLPWVACTKERTGDRRVRVELPPGVDLRGVRRAVVVDDIASSGTTLASAARALRRRGVATVDAAVVHAIFAQGALARIRRAGVRKVGSCDTVPHETNAIATASCLADATRDLLRVRRRPATG